MERNERTIIKKCQEGRIEEFSILYDRYIKKIYSFLYFRTNKVELAEDLTSQTFLKALKAIDKFNVKENYFSAWLYKIARNNLIDYYRGEKEIFDIDSLYDLGVDNEEDEKVDRNLNTLKIKQCLNNLSVEQKEIIVLKVWDELSYSEISEIVGKSADNCKVIFSRALKKLKKEMPLSLFILFLLNL